MVTGSSRELCTSHRCMVKKRGWLASLRDNTSQVIAINWTQQPEAPPYETNVEHRPAVPRRMFHYGEKAFGLKPIDPPHIVIRVIRPHK